VWQVLLDADQALPDLNDILNRAVHAASDLITLAEHRAPRLLVQHSVVETDAFGQYKSVLVHGLLTSYC
jgi:hypothetical protein